MKIRSESQYKETGQLVFRAVIFLLLLLPAFGMAQQNNFFIWKQFPSIPDPVGFAGSYAGVSNGALLVGGGANFPDGIGPRGNTKKTWYDQVYVLEKSEGEWREAGKFSRILS